MASGNDDSDKIKIQFNLLNEKMETTFKKSRNDSWQIRNEEHELIRSIHSLEQEAEDIQKSSVELQLENEHLSIQMQEHRKLTRETMKRHFPNARMAKNNTSARASAVKKQCDESKQQQSVCVERIEDLERKFNELETSGFEKQFEPIIEKIGTIQKQIIEAKKISQAENETFQLDLKTTISKKEAVLEQIRSEHEIGAALKTTEQQNQMKLECFRSKIIDAEREILNFQNENAKVFETNENLYLEICEIEKAVDEIGNEIKTVENRTFEMVKSKKLELEMMNEKAEQLRSKVYELSIEVENCSKAFEITSANVELSEIKIRASEEEKANVMKQNVELNETIRLEKQRFEFLTEFAKLTTSPGKKHHSFEIKEKQLKNLSKLDDEWQKLQLRDDESNLNYERKDKENQSQWNNHKAYRDEKLGKLEDNVKFLNESIQTVQIKKQDLEQKDFDIRFKREKIAKLITEKAALEKEAQNHKRSKKSISSPTIHKAPTMKTVEKNKTVLVSNLTNNASRGDSRITKPKPKRVLFNDNLPRLKDMNEELKEYENSPKLPKIKAVPFVSTTKKSPRKRKSNGSDDGLDWLFGGKFN